MPAGSTWAWSCPCGTDASYVYRALRNMQRIPARVTAGYQRVLLPSLLCRMHPLLVPPAFQLAHCGLYSWRFGLWICSNGGRTSLLLYSRDMRNWFEHRRRAKRGWTLSVPLFVPYPYSVPLWAVSFLSFKSCLFFAVVKAALFC